MKLFFIGRYLAGGPLQRHISSSYRVSKQHFGQILDDVCNAICTVLADQFNANRTKQDWLDIANNYNYRWNLPNCLGSIDGKHVAIKKPNNAGSLFYNYKGFHSIVLMAIADAHYRFITIDIGAYGSEGDAGVFNTSAMGKAILNNRLDLPDNTYIGSQKYPFYFIGDDAFPLKERIMKPFVGNRSKPLTDEERIFNYRLSRARRCVENAFGILVARFQCLGRTMYCGPDRAQKIISACCHLHNFLMNTPGSAYCPANFADSYNGDGEMVEGNWRLVATKLHSVQGKSGRNADEAKIMRECLKNYVNSPEGRVDWQRKAIFMD